MMYIDSICQEKNEKGLSSSEDCIDETIQVLNE